jgi:hypothetical protein
MLVVTFQDFGFADLLIGRLHRCPRFVYNYEQQ